MKISKRGSKVQINLTRNEAELLCSALDEFDLLPGDDNYLPGDNIVMYGMRKAFDIMFPLVTD